MFTRDGSKKCVDFAGFFFILSPNKDRVDAEKLKFRSIRGEPQ
jgi:hypothetical protein